MPGRAAVAVAAVAMVLGVAVTAVNLIAAEGALGAVAQVSVVGLLALVVGVAAGLPVVATLGVAALGAAHLVAVVSGDATFDQRVVIVAPLLWATFETAMRSFELRPPVTVSRSALTDWLGVLVALFAGTVAVVIVAGVAVGAAPDGGLTFRIASVVVVVMAAVALAVVDLTHRRAGRARG